MSARADVDVLIGGGGMVGAAVAALLATDPRARELKVTLAETEPATQPLPGGPVELRVSALSRASERLLVAVGAWPLLANRAPSPYVRMRVWDAADAPDGARALVFDAADLGEPDLGHIVENRSVAAALLAVALRQGVTLVRAPLTGAELSREQASVTLGERALSARLVVAADGARSKLRGWAGIEVESRAYPQRAVVAQLKPEREHGGEARQRFLPGGPLALLPLADGTVSLVWSAPGEAAEALCALDAEAFAERVTEASGAVLGRLTPCSKRLSFALSRDHATTYAGTRLVLVGDAAHTVHPLAGQGANLGLLDAAVLVETLLQAHERGEDLGDPATLERYSRARRADNLLVSAAMHGLYRLFGSTRSAVALARRNGLGLVERAGPVKQRLMREALGLGARLPARLRADAH